MKSHGAATDAVAPRRSTAEKAADAAAAAEEHSHKAQEAAETAAACARRACAEAASLTGRGSGEAAAMQGDPKVDETEEQQITTTPAQTHATEEPQASAVVPLSDADAQLLAAAEKQAAAKQQQGGSNTPHAYLFYATELNEGSLIMQWTPTQMSEEDMHAKNLLLLASFTPAKHKTVSKSKLTQNGGVTCLLQEMKV